jgi:hypothetical protein
MNLRHSLPTRCLAALLAIGLLAACGEDDPGNPTGTTMTDEMTETTMADDMTETTMGDNMTETTMTDEMTDMTSG